MTVRPDHEVRANARRNMEGARVHRHARPIPSALAWLPFVALQHALNSENFQSSFFYFLRVCFVVEKMFFHIQFM